MSLPAHGRNTARFVTYNINFPRTRQINILAKPSLLHRHREELWTTAAPRATSWPVQLRPFSYDRQDGVDKVRSVSDPSVSSVDASGAWRKSQLSQITGRFSDLANATEDGDQGRDRAGADEENVGVVENDEFTASGEYVEVPNIKSDDDVQQMWRQMESRVLRRRMLTVEQRGSKVGRRNVRKTEEDFWLEAGMYGESGDSGIAAEDHKGDK